MKSFITVCISVWHLAGLCSSHPLEQRIVEVAEPQNEIIIYIIDQTKSDPSKRKPRQEDGGVDAGDAAEGLESTAQIGTNVIKVVTSALTGNVNGIFDGSFNLFGTGSTRNQVEGFFQSLVGGLVNSIVGPTTANPNKGTASSGASAAGSSGAASSGSGSSGGASNAAETVAATTAKAPTAQYVILLNQDGGQIKGANLILSPQSLQSQNAVTVKTATATVRATTKKSDEDDDEEENEENADNFRINKIKIY